MTFFQKAKRFFEPVQSKIHIYIEGLCVAFLWGINGVLHIFFLERITYYLTQKPDEFLSILIIYGLAIGVFEILNFSLRKWGWVKIEGYTTNYVSAKYLKLFIELDNNFIESLGTGKLIAIIREGVDRWGLLLWQAIEVCMRLTIALLFGAYIVAQINLYYALILLGVFTIFFLISRFFNTRLFPYRRRRQLNRVDISRSMVKVLMSKNEILQNNSIDEHNQEISALFDKDIQINQDMGTYRTLLVRNSPLGISLILLAIYSLYGPKVLSGNIELNVLVGLTGSMIVIQRIVTDSILSYIDFTKEFIKVETLWEIFDTAPRLAGYHTGSPFSPKKKPIIIKDITYGYNENNVFEHFSLTIEQGKKTALVGESGGGKTTLMKLIAGYLHPDEGYISVLGNRLDETALKTYYPHIGYLTQEPSVFDGTIRENLQSAVSLLSHSEETPLEKKLTEALRLAHCDFVFDLEHGLDTEIGERGVRLSGGQKQRLAIAKIFLKDPEIILLDEPTSALDSFSEEQITKALDTLFRDRTVLIIAHRLQTVKKSDTIMVIEGGKIQEQGSHEDLIANGGIYHKMLELQSGF